MAYDYGSEAPTSTARACRSGALCPRGASMPRRTARRLASERLQGEPLVRHYLSNAGFRQK